MIHGKQIQSKFTYLAPIVLAVSLLAACAVSLPGEDEEGVDGGIRWVRDAAEYEALSRQAYAVATMQLAEKIANQSWSALPYQVDAADLPPAVILDVDETAVSNVRFQVTLEPPFEDRKLYEWSDSTIADPVPGAPEFVASAVDAGVQVFFVTNRPCEAYDDIDDSCPQKPVVIEELIEAGFPANKQNVFLSGERPGWGKEKQSRRDWVAQYYRVIMLFGDDLGDFIPCTRRRAVLPCTENATAESRRALTKQYADYWGNGWYILPNPMHGSWTSFP